MTRKEHKDILNQFFNEMWSALFPGMNNLVLEFPRRNVDGKCVLPDDINRMLGEISNKLVGIKEKYEKN